MERGNVTSNRRVRRRRPRSVRPITWAAAVVGTLLLVGLALALKPSPSGVAAASPAPAVTFAQVQAVINQRCVMCHNADVQNKNVALHTEPLVRQQAQAIYQQVVVQKLMPLNNATQITEDERALLKRWHEAGQP